MDTFGIYKKQSKNSYVVLSKSERLDLYQKMQDGDEESKQILINSCLPLVIKVATKWHKKYKKILGLEDLVQIGNFAVCKLIEKYNPKYELSTFITRIVSNAIVDEVMSGNYNVNSCVSINKYVSDKITQIKSLNTNNLDEISKKTKISKKNIKKFLSISDTKREKIPENKKVLKTYVSSNSGGCLAEMFELLEENVESSLDRSIFMCYVKYIDKPNKVRLVARDFEMPADEIKSIVTSVKKTLKNSKGNLNG